MTDDKCPKCGARQRCHLPEYIHYACGSALIRGEFAQDHNCRANAAEADLIVHQNALVKESNLRIAAEAKVRELEGDKIHLEKMVQINRDGWDALAHRLREVKAAVDPARARIVGASGDYCRGFHDTRKDVLDALLDGADLPEHPDTRRVREMEALPYLIANRLLLSGGGGIGSRLVVVDDEKYEDTGGDLGGWCHSAVENQVREAMAFLSKAALSSTPPAEPALCAECAAKQRVKKRMLATLKQVGRDVMPFMIAIRDAGEHHTSGYWIIDSIFQDGGPTDDLDDIKDEIDAILRDGDGGKA